MPELRRDPVLGRWVIVASERSKRPTDFKIEPQPARSDFCPLCEGNESKTPPEIVAYRRAGSPRNTPGWRVRVVPNKFPALQVEGEPEKRGYGLYDRMNGIGAHEVIIETPKHELTLTAMEEPHIQEVLWAYRDRLVDLKNDKRLVYGMLFKNVGATAGASLEHTHSQLIVTPIVPRTALQEMEGCREFFRYRGRCLFCDMVAQEMEQQARVVAASELFVAFEPYASRFPFETWILPRRHESHFENLQKRDVEELSSLLKMVLLKIETALKMPPYNYIIHTSPLNSPLLEDYHWHFEIIPRLTRVAGFEWGTGFYINPVPPESAAEFLREVS